MKAKTTTKTPAKTKTVAAITIFDAPDMTPRGRKRVADWMIKAAHCFEKYGKEYNKRFTQRYTCKPVTVGHRG